MEGRTVAWGKLDALYRSPSLVLYKAAGSCYLRGYCTRKVLGLIDVCDYDALLGHVSTSFAWPEALEENLSCRWAWLFETQHSYSSHEVTIVTMGEDVVEDLQSCVRCSPR